MFWICSFPTRMQRSTSDQRRFADGESLTPQSPAISDLSFYLTEICCFLNSSSFAPPTGGSKSLITGTFRPGSPPPPPSAPSLHSGHIFLFLLPTCSQLTERVKQAENTDRCSRGSSTSRHHRDDSRAWRVFRLRPGGTALSPSDFRGQRRC